MYESHKQMNRWDGQWPLTPPDPIHPPPRHPPNAFQSAGPSHTKRWVPKALSDPCLMCVRSKLAGEGGFERDLTCGRGGGSCCLASRQCGKRQTGSFKDSQKPPPSPPLQPLNPQRFLKAGHDWGVCLFCRHWETLEKTQFFVIFWSPLSVDHRYSHKAASCLLHHIFPRRQFPSVSFLPRFEPWSIDYCLTLKGS